MKCFLGNELAVGDKVILLESGRSNSWFVWGEIVRFTPQQVVVSYKVNWSTTFVDETRRYPQALIKPWENHATCH